MNGFINVAFKSVTCLSAIGAPVVAYLWRDVAFYTTSRSCTAPGRAAARAAASPLHSWAGSGVRACTAGCTRRTAGPLRARTSGSSRSRAPSLADSPPAPAGTWTGPSDRTAGTARRTSRSRWCSAGEAAARKHSTAWRETRILKAGRWLETIINYISRWILSLRMIWVQASEGVLHPQVLCALKYHCIRCSQSTNSLPSLQNIKITK